MTIKTSFIKTILLTLLTLTSYITYSQQDTTIRKNLSFDVIMGPYLFIDHTPYDAVMLQGARLGIENNHRTTYQLEYLVGQQDDDKNTLGMTHSASFSLNQSFTKSERRISPYGNIGFGFFEFKAFNSDVYGVSFHSGLGIELNLHKNIKGIIESRYLNLAQLQIQGKNEIGVFWGLRARF